MAQAKEVNKESSLPDFVAGEHNRNNREPLNTVCLKAVCGVCDLSAQTLRFNLVLRSPAFGKSMRPLRPTNTHRLLALFAVSSYD